MEITKIELKILTKEFLVASNRVLRAGFEFYSEELAKFTKFLESKPIIWNYILSCGKPEFDVENLNLMWKKRLLKLIKVTED